MTSEKRDAACERISKGDKQKNQPDILSHSHRAAEMKTPNCTPHTNTQKVGADSCVRPPELNAIGLGSAIHLWSCACHIRSNVCDHIFSKN